MAGLVEITIKKEIIMAQATKLDKIAQEVSLKKITSTVSSSKGKTANSINSLIQELNSMGNELTKLLNENAKNVREISNQFSIKDANIASKLKGE